jgi:hypothetical protein
MQSSDCPSDNPMCYTGFGGMGGEAASGGFCGPSFGGFDGGGFMFDGGGFMFDGGGPMPDGGGPKLDAGGG